MPSHDLSSTEIVKVVPGELAQVKDLSIDERWKKELKFDFELEMGKALQRASKNTRLSDMDKAELLIKGAAAVKQLGRATSGGSGKTANATQVNVYTTDPTKP